MVLQGWLVTPASGYREAREQYEQKPFVHGDIPAITALAGNDFKCHKPCEYVRKLAILVHHFQVAAGTISLAGGWT